MHPEPDPTTRTLMDERAADRSALLRAINQTILSLVHNLPVLSDDDLRRVDQLVSSELHRRSEVESRRRDRELMEKGD